MNTPKFGSWRPYWRRFVFLLGAGLAVNAAGQTGLKPGDIVTTNFSMMNRFLWTNDTGRVFAPSNSVIRLSDFDGKILFLEFFAVW